MRASEVVPGLTSDEYNRLRFVLEELSSYLDLRRAVIAGGAAIRIQAALNGSPLPSRSLGDVDLEVDDLDAVAPAIRERFLVGHTHLDETGKLHSVVLAHPGCNTKVDLFFPPVSRSHFTVTVAGFDVSVSSAAIQFAHAVSDLVRQADMGRMHPKRLESAALLGRIADPDEARESWNRDFEFEGDIFEVMNSVVQKVRENPQWMSEIESARSTVDPCGSCQELDGFPLAGRLEYQVALGRIPGLSAVLPASRPLVKLEEPRIRLDQEPIKGRDFLSL